MVTIRFFTRFLLFYISFGINNFKFINKFPVRKKFKIPQDFSVCGFDNTPLSSYHKINLTTVDHCVEQKGKEAIDIIHRKNSLKRNTKKKHYIMRLEYEPELIKRTSIGLLRK